MKRNRLYTVNKWNRPAFMPEKNLFLGGGDFFKHQGGGTYGAVTSTPNKWNTWSSKLVGDLQLNYGENFSNPTVTNSAGNIVNAGNTSEILKTATNTKNTENNYAANAPNVGMAIASAAGPLMDSIKTGDPRGAWDTLDPVYHLAGGRESAVGNGLSDAGVALTKSGNPWLMLAGAGLKIVGGLTNAAFGIKEDKQKKEIADQSISSNSNFVSNAKSLDDIKGPQSMTSTDIYEGGWFSGGKADDKNREMAENMLAAYSWADRSMQNNANNLISDQIADNLRNYSAYGGPLDFGGGALGLMQQNRYFDTIDKRSEAIAGKNGLNTAYTGGAKTFDFGGLKSSFLDEFGSDPIGAAVRYNQGLEAMAAQEKAKQIETAKEAEYLGLQQRLNNLETENQGLQALMAAQTMPAIPESTTPSSSSTPSKATSNGSTWDYIEDQLRRSGKFNDVQIEGIKYNLQRESSLDPTAVGDGGSAFGLGQWHGDRKPSDMSLEGQTQHLIDTLSNYDGRLHWIGRDNYEGFLNARTPEEAHYYITRGYERPRKDIVDKVKRYSDMSLRRLNAFGGELGTNGTDWTNGLLYIDEGGSHESNPLDGVPLGLDPQGIPNLVEEGETVFNDYVFSDRMKVPFFMYKELGLGGVMKKKGKEMSFADASKKLAQESEQRPNDPISQDGLQASLARLAEVQEAERMKKNAREYRGLEDYACGGKIGHKYVGGGFTLIPGESRASYLQRRREYEKAHPKPKQITTGAKSGFKSSENPWGLDADFMSKIAFNVPEIKEEAVQAPAITEEQRHAIAMDGYNPEDNNFIAATTPPPSTDKEEGSGEGYDPYPTWMRYAPVVGAGIMSLTDLLGLTNKPDYTMADKIEAAANGAAYAPNIEYKPIGDYMRYTPLDRLFQQNQLNAIARAADRTIMNSSLPTASKYAALLGANYNNQIAAGNLFRQEQESNRAQYERTKDFNRKTNMFNSQMDLEAAMANARYRQQAQSLGLSGLGQAAALRDSIDARVGAAKSANLTNFLTSLGNIGRENFALNQINSDRSRQYGVYKNGVSDYKRNPTVKRKRKWYDIFG